MPRLPEAPLRLSMMMRVPSWAASGSEIEPRSDVDAASRRERRDHPDRLAGIALRARRLRKRDEHDCNETVQHGLVMIAALPEKNRRSSQ
jgi:hypothetical protein